MTAVWCQANYSCWCQILVNMMTSSNGNIFRVTGHLCGNSPVTGEFPTQRPVTRSFDVFFDLRLNKRFSKQSWGWWFETLSCPLWRHPNGQSGSIFKFYLRSLVLTHWGQVIYASPGRRQAIIWTNVGILSIGPLGTNFSDVFIEIHTLSFKKTHFKMSPAKRRSFCCGLNVLKQPLPSCVSFFWFYKVSNL